MSIRLTGGSTSYISYAPSYNIPAGSGDYIRNEILNNEPWTLSIWAYSTSPSSRYLFSLYKNTPSLRFALADADYNTGSIIMYEYESASKYTHTTIPAAPQINKWNHFCFVFESGFHTCYFNGSGYRVAAGYSAFLYDKPNNLKVGASHSSPAGFIGSMAEFAMWSGVLREPDILALASGFSPDMVNPDALILYTPLDDSPFLYDGSVGDGYSYFDKINKPTSYSPDINSFNSTSVYNPSGHPAMMRSPGIQNTYSVLGQDSTLNLFLQCTEVGSGNLDMFIPGAVHMSGDFSLFTWGHMFCATSGEEETNAYNIGFDTGFRRAITFNNSPPFHIIGHVPETYEDELELYLEARQIHASSVPLFVHGIFSDTETMNLYLKSHTGVEASGTQSMFIWSAANSGIFKALELVITASNEPTGFMNLAMRGPFHQDGSASMNLFLKRYEDANGVAQINDTVPLFMSNNYVLYSSSVDLFMNAPSGTDGAVPWTGSMNLFINRYSNSQDGNLPLSLFGPSGYEENVTLYLEGMPNIHEAIDMIISGATQNTNNITLYTHGF